MATTPQLEVLLNNYLNKARSNNLSKEETLLLTELWLKNKFLHSAVPPKKDWLKYLCLGYYMYTLLESHTENYHE